MSRRATDWAAKLIVPKVADKAVLWALADACNAAGWDAFPSIAAIAHFTSLNRKQVIARLARLQAAGLIADSGRRVGATRQIKVYRLAGEPTPIGNPSPVCNGPRTGTVRRDRTIPDRGHGTYPIEIRPMVGANVSPMHPSPSSRAVAQR